MNLPTAEKKPNQRRLIRQIMPPPHRAPKVYNESRRCYLFLKHHMRIFIRIPDLLQKFFFMQFFTLHSNAHCSTATNFDAGYVEKLDLSNNDMHISFWSDFFISFLRIRKNMMHIYRLIFKKNYI